MSLSRRPIQYVGQIRRGTDWNQNASATHAAATATQAAVTNTQFSLTKVSASFGTAPAGPILLQILDGATVIWQRQVPTTGIDLDFCDCPLRATAGNLMQAVLADGGAGVVGVVNIAGLSDIVAD